MKQKIYNGLARYLYFKLCWNRSYSHLSIPLQIVDKVMMIAIFLKVFNIVNYFAIGVIVSIYVAIMVVLGHFDLKHGIASKETSLRNKYNPEIQEILKRR